LPVSDPIFCRVSLFTATRNNAETLDSVTNYECLGLVFEPGTVTILKWYLNRTGEGGVLRTADNFADNHDVNQSASNHKSSTCIRLLLALHNASRSFDLLWQRMGDEAIKSNGDDKALRTGHPTVSRTSLHPDLQTPSVGENSPSSKR
jgi:hypothetical protein